jgi:hypothetical protein
LIGGERGLNVRRVIIVIAGAVVVVIIVSAPSRVRRGPSARRLGGQRGCRGASQVGVPERILEGGEYGREGYLRVTVIVTVVVAVNDIGIQPGGQRRVLLGGMLFGQCPMMMIICAKLLCLGRGLGEGGRGEMALFGTG